MINDMYYDGMNHHADDSYRRLNRTNRYDKHRPVLTHAHAQLLEDKDPVVIGIDWAKGHCKECGELLVCDDDDCHCANSFCVTYDPQEQDNG